MKIEILTQEELNQYTERQIATLFAQLSPDKPQQSVREVLSPDNPIYFAICKDDDKVIGIAAMSVYTVISGRKGWIEDVVVDSATRGNGIGRRLIEKLLEIAREKELTEVLLFTEDHRVAAINLYKSFGFEEKQTQIYALKDEVLYNSDVLLSEL